MFIHIRGILARHVMKQLLLPFFCCFFGFIFLFFIGDLQDDLSDLLKNKNQQDNAYGSIIQYFLFIIPAKIHLITPMALLLATMYCFSNLNRHNEINAVRSSGISIFRLGLPVFIFALLMSCFLFVSNEYLQGYFNQKAKIIHTELTGKTDDKSTFAFTIGSAKEGWRQWEMNYMEDGLYSDIDLQYIGKDSKPKWSISAKKARLTEDQGWVLTDVTRKDHTASLQKGAPTFHQKIVFAHVQDNPIKMRHFNQIKSHMTIRDVNDRLNSQIQQSAEQQQRLRVKYYALIFTPFGCMLSVLLGIPLSITQQRQGALASSAKALGIMLAYYIVLQMFQKFGNSGHLPAYIAGSVPTLSFIGLGIYISSKK
ncbi:MAG: YjgP/YjgQ family permease [Lentisphaeraceae bacterium]|nr:YjgP/YjgQ family permease [Lentisphaeraceae bacterium]